MMNKVMQDDIVKCFTVVYKVQFLIMCDWFLIQDMFPKLACIVQMMEKLDNIKSEPVIFNEGDKKANISCQNAN